MKFSQKDKKAILDEKVIVLTAHAELADYATEYGNPLVKVYLLYPDRRVETHTLEWDELTPELTALFSSSKALHEAMCREVMRMVKGR